jgi:hypothetical protein
MFAAGNGGDKWIITKAAKGHGKPFLIIIAEDLIGKGQHMVLKPGGANFRNLLHTQRRA